MTRMFQALAVVWFGLILGISFIATPVKFQAETLSLPAALDVGRHTFAASHLVQLVLGALLALGALGMTARVRVLLLATLGILVLQHVVLLPILDARATAVIAGTPPTGTSPHTLYVVLEVAKLVLVALIGVGRPRVRLPRPSTLWRT